MTLHQLRIFQVVAKRLNITKASEELCISQPAVSHQLKLLEDECGIKLYRSTSRGIELTPEGKLFLCQAEPVLLELEKLKRFRANLSDGKPKPFILGCSYSLSVSFLPQVLAAFRKRHPDVPLILRTNDSPAIERLVFDSEIEIGLINRLTHSPSLVYDDYREGELVVFASAEHPLAAKRRLTKTDVRGVPFFCKRRRVADISRQFEEIGIELNIAMQSESPEAVKTAVKKGLGLGILYWDLVEPEIKSGELKLVRIENLKMPVYTSIVYRKGSALSLDAQNFLLLLREWPGQNDHVIPVVDIPLAAKH